MCRNADEPAAPPPASLLTSCFASTASSAYTGVIVGILVAAVIVASPIALAKWLYSNRHRVCLGNTSGEIPPSSQNVLKSGLFD